jgi:glutaredoxin
MTRIWNDARACAIAIGALMTVTTAASAAKKVVYMGAPDCPYCRQYETLYEKDLMAACRAHGVQYRRFMLSRVSDAGKAEKWPAEVRSLFAGLGGTPHFIIVDNGHVIQEVNKINAGRMAVASTCGG